MDPQYQAADQHCSNRCDRAANPSVAYLNNILLRHDSNWRQNLNVYMYQFKRVILRNPLVGAALFNELEDTPHTPYCSDVLISVILTHLDLL